MLYFLIEAEHNDGTIYPLGVCEQAHSENDVGPGVVLHSRPLPKGTRISCELLKPEDIRWRMFDLLEWLKLRQKTEDFPFYVLRASLRAVAVISASSQEDAEEVARKVNSLLPENIRVTPHFFGMGPASDCPDAFGWSPASLATRIQEFINA